MLKINLNKLLALNSKKLIISRCIPYTTAGCSHIQEKTLNEGIKHEIENHWRGKIDHKPFDRNNVKDKFYVLSMFPYPSGHLHMGHVRVYSISDAIARFYRLRGKNVLHPMGWDAFGLPAENAAIQRNIPADEWTQQNIEHMKKQIIELGCSFDWETELTTCDPNYYKWTQKLFLMLFNEGLAYQREAIVNWDPIDKTVLADEQVDEKGCSWRSGAKVEKKLLRQWFIKTTKFAEQLYEGLADPLLKDWRDIINLQKHWIGECDGWNLSLKLTNDRVIDVWSKSPEDFAQASFIAVRKSHLLNQDKIDEGLLKIRALNPFSGNGSELPIIVTEEVEFPSFNDVYLGVPLKSEIDLKLSEKYNLPMPKIQKHSSDNETMMEEEMRQQIIAKAQEMGIGGDYKVSSKLKDWLISRQRYWGTPIPIIHCESCGAVPVPEKDLPVKLPLLKEDVGKPLSQNESWKKCECPKCGNSNARRETDTMDTFVDSSWYFLRYLNVNNELDVVDKEIGNNLMPVDVYIGGKEHAVLHLYYARFMNHFLHSKGYVSHPEPFKRLLVQGMVKGKTFRVKETGQYLKADDVEIINEKKQKAHEKSTNKAVEIFWEKMSKSKLNGVDPVDVINTHGCDTMRLIMLGDVAPTSHRNWSETTFPGIIKWQNRLWLTLHDFNLHRLNAKEIQKTTAFDEHEQKLHDSANFFPSGATFNFVYSHQLSVAISKMQGLTNAIRRATPDVMAHGEQYERALSAQIIMLAPFAPHFASELWSRFIAAPNRVNEKSQYIRWNEDVFGQEWPRIDAHHKVKLTVKINNSLVHELKIPCGELNKLNGEQAVLLALKHEEIVKGLKNRKIVNVDWKLYRDYEGILNLNIERNQMDEKLDDAELENKRTLEQ